MPICPSCHYGYDEGHSFCPKCGAGSHYPHKCGSFSMFCLRMAQLASLVGVMISIVGGIIALTNGDWVQSLFIFLLSTPICMGSFVAFGLVIRYAKGE